MASSGTYSFGPSVAQLGLSAFSRIGIRRPAILAEHMADCYNETNFMLSAWSNQNPPNLWTVDLVTVPLVADQAVYDVDSSTVMILDAYISFNDNPTLDRLIFPISRTEYASYPEKSLSGTPSVFWFDRLISPTLTLWAVPDASDVLTLKYYRCTQVQDANLPSGETPNIPYRFIDAWVADLSYRLARIYAPQMEQMRKADAKEAWALAATNDTENVALNIVPGLISYYNGQY